MSDSSESEIDSEDLVDVDDEDEEDSEQITVTSLFDDAKFDNVPGMLAYIKSSFNFDLVSVQQRLDLDFLGMVKMVNYVRDQVREGHGQSLDLSKSSIFDDDIYLLPVLEDDALLYNLEDIMHCEPEEQQYMDKAIPAANDPGQETAAHARICELNDALLQSQQAALAAQQRLELAEKALNLSQRTDFDKESRPIPTPVSGQRSQYKGNYDGPELHRIMIADKPRTDTYRDFILGNSHLFKDRVVLDVGCGTSILSLFCVEAGAKIVYAVDQSESIINKAREIVFHNGKQDAIKLIHGRIQDVSLPVKQVDIIVSEWMGYCLLFEAMLDSVIYARQRYLKEGGLMVPAESTLYIAPFSYPEYRATKLDYWDEVYGYNMECFKPDVLQVVDVDTCLSESHLSRPKCPFITFDLHTAIVSDLSFHDKPFSFELADDIIEPFDGFAIWFDVTFSAPGHPLGSATSKVLDTGPESASTHWRQGLCLIDRKRDHDAPKHSSGRRIDGEISYDKEGKDMEGLDITIKWRVDGKEEGKQLWLLH